MRISNSEMPEMFEVVSEARCFSFLNTLTSASFVTVSQASVVNLEANLGIAEEDLPSTEVRGRKSGTRRN